MPRAKKPWFRVYAEITHDRKLRRLPPASRWAWVAVLAIARQSPRAGVLLLDDNSKATLADIADEAALSEKDTRAALDSFIDAGMIHMVNGAIVVTNWSSRQFESDDVTARANASRERNQAPNDAPYDPPNDGGSNVATPVAKSVTTNGVSNDSDIVASSDGCNVAPRVRAPVRPRNRDSESSESQSYREDIGTEIPDQDGSENPTRGQSPPAPPAHEFGKPFVPPTWEQVEAHFRALGKPEFAKLFWLHYQEKKWVGVSSWSYKAEMWIERKSQFQTKPAKRSPHVATGSMAEQLEAMRLMDEQIEHQGGLLH